MGGHQIEIYFDSLVAPWILEQWGSSARKEPDGGVILTLSSETLEYPSRLVLSFAPHARPVSPPQLMEKVQSDAQAVLESTRKVSDLKRETFGQSIPSCWLVLRANCASLHVVV